MDREAEEQDSGARRIPFGFAVSPFKIQSDVFVLSLSKDE
jgi:hypothetical protein